MRSVVEFDDEFAVVADKVISVEDHHILELQNAYIARFVGDSVEPDKSYWQLVRKMDAEWVYVPIAHVYYWHEIPDEKVAAIGSKC